MSWESGVMRLSTELNAERPNVFPPCKRTSRSSSLKSDIAAGKSDIAVYRGASSCAASAFIS